VPAHKRGPLSPVQFYIAEAAGHAIQTALLAVSGSMKTVRAAPDPGALQDQFGNVARDVVRFEAFEIVEVHGRHQRPVSRGRRCRTRKGPFLDGLTGRFSSR